MSLRTTLAAGFSVALLGAQVTAIMMMPDVRKVPVDRLLGNLERAAKENPTDVQAQMNLARLHAMAYALKSRHASSGEPALRGQNRDSLLPSGIDGAGGGAARLPPPGTPRRPPNI